MANFKNNENSHFPCRQRPAYTVSAIEDHERVEEAFKAQKASVWHIGGLVREKLRKYKLQKLSTGRYKNR